MPDRVVCIKCCRGHLRLSDKRLSIIGWRQIDGFWECPVCTGNKRCMMRILLRADQQVEDDIAEEFKEFLDVLGYSQPGEMEG